MYWSKNLPTSGMNWKYVWGEVLELLYEVKVLNLKGIQDELCDIYTCCMCAITTSTGINIPIIWKRSSIVWIERSLWWEQRLREQKLPFKDWMLKFGSNYSRRTKRQIILWIASREDLWA